MLSLSTVPASIVHELAPTGTLRASINLGNPVLAHGTPATPGGVTVELARALATRLAVPVELICFDAARKSFEALSAGHADICFLAIEPEREAEVAFTEPYVVIEGVFVVRQDAEITTNADVDREGIRVGVKTGSAYDLFLSRTLEHATVVRGDDGVDAFLELELEVAAGIREPLTNFIEREPGFRLLDGRFMGIRQAIGTNATRSPEAVEYLRGFVEEAKASGLVAAALRPT